MLVKFQNTKNKEKILKLWGWGMEAKTNSLDKKKNRIVLASDLPPGIPFIALKKSNFQPRISSQTMYESIVSS